MDIVTGENASRHYVAFRPNRVEPGLRLEYEENKEARLKLFKWLNAALPGLEKVLREIQAKLNSAEKPIEASNNGEPSSTSGS